MNEDKVITIKDDYQYYEIGNSVIITSLNYIPFGLDAIVDTYIQKPRTGRHGIQMSFILHRCEDFYK